MIEPLKNRVYPDGMIIAPSWAEMIEKINELVDHSNAFENALIDNGILAYAKPKTDSAEPTEKMYTLDEVAEILASHNKKPCSGLEDVCGTSYCNFNIIECWKKALSGWLKGE